jgi:hypothetical protein
LRWSIVPPGDGADRRKTIFLLGELKLPSSMIVTGRVLLVSPGLNVTRPAPANE